MLSNTEPELTYLDENQYQLVERDRCSRQILLKKTLLVMTQHSITTCHPTSSGFLRIPVGSYTCQHQPVPQDSFSVKLVEAGDVVVRCCHHPRQSFQKTRNPGTGWCAARQAHKMGPLQRYFSSPLSVVGVPILYACRGSRRHVVTGHVVPPSTPLGSHIAACSCQVEDR